MMVTHQGIAFYPNGASPTAKHYLPAIVEATTGRSTCSSITVVDAATFDVSRSATANAADVVPRSGARNPPRCCGDMSAPLFGCIKPPRGELGPRVGRRGPTTNRRHPGRNSPSYESSFSSATPRRATLMIKSGGRARQLSRRAANKRRLPQGPW